MSVLPLNSFSLKEALKKSEVKESDIEILREWFLKQPHLPKTDDIYLILFLHSNYYRLEPTKTTIENFYTIRTHVPEFFSNRDPFLKELREQCNVMLAISLKENSKQGNQIIFNAIMDPDPSHYLFNECTKLLFMISELSVLQKGLTNGFDYIVDVKNVSLGHIGRMNLMGLKKILFYIQEAVPIRLKHIHILNHNAAVETLLNMCKPFMKKELFDMIRFHSSLKSLEEFMSLDLLPNEIGGKAGNMKDLQKNQLKIMDENREWFLRTTQEWTVNESLRVGNPKTSSDLFGVEGSFKKLDID